nr:glycosyltransferase family 2 protein [uncultured Porphyromonas sp.]
MSSPLLSVIIPLYRAESTLAACIEQLLAQTRSQAQLVFIDDCSPDGCWALLNEARPQLEARGYTVTLLRHEVNGGVAVARNTGIDAARGEYIYALDADDLFVPQTLELIEQRIEQTGADLIGCNWILQQGQSKRLMYQAAVTTGKEAWQALCHGSLRWNLWLWAFRRTLLQDGEQELRFIPTMNMGEDLGLMGKLFLKAGRVEMIPEHLYAYVRNEGQQTNHYSELHWQQLRANLQSLEDYIQQHQLHEAASDLAFLKLQLKLPLLVSGRRDDYDRWQQLYPEANKAIPHVGGGIHTRLLQRMAGLGQYWYVWLYYRVVLKGLYSLLYR